MIVADDLTGANDTGLQFAKHHLRTKVLIGTPYHLQDILDAEVCVINTETRSLSEAAAYEQIKSIANMISKHSFSIYYKKVDSTLRGNIGVEVNAILDEINFDYAVIVPAYPRNNRRTVGGYHLVGELLIEDSDLSNDPKFPVKSSYIPDLFHCETTRKGAHFNLNEIRGEQLSLKVSKSVLEGNQLLSFDCASDEDFVKIVSATNDPSKKVLWVGSAGLMDSLYSGQKEHVTEAAEENELSKVQGPYLVVAGSVSAITRSQTAYLEEKNFTKIEIHPVDLMEHHLEEKNLSHFIQVAKERLIQSGNVVLTTQYSEETKLEFQSFLADRGITREQAGDFIASSLGSLGACLISSVELKGVFLTGGDIAYQTCKHLNLNALEIIDEVEEGIPLCRMLGDNLPPIPLVTKAGAFGNVTSIYHSIKKMAAMPIQNGQRERGGNFV